MAPPIEIPTLMRAVQGVDYGDIDEMLHVVNDVPTPPKVTDLPKSKQKNSMILKVLSVSLAPGDCRVLSGLTRELQGPPSFPYIPGGDCCGIVVDLPDQSSTRKESLPFTIGDRVVARFTEKPLGALGEYAIVSTLVADKVPDNVSSDDAAALISASPVIDLVKPVKPGERVLVLGAGGGIGAHFCQMLRLQGASYVVGVSQDTASLTKSPIKCDDAVDYTTTNVFSLEKYQNEKFDTIFDFAGGGYQSLERNLKLKEALIVKPASMGGRFITTVPLHGPSYEVHSIWAALKIFLFPGLWKALISRTLTRSKLPKYSFVMALDERREPATKVLEYAASGKLKAVVDDKGPFPFTTDGIRSAFRLQESRHAHGKVVISVAKS